MPLENANTISKLDANWPLGIDSVSRGDDHIRLLKSVLKAQFPGKNGHGFEKPITISEDELNSLPGKVNDIVNKMFPIGTVVLRMDDKNPANIYGGTWSLVTADASLSFGNGGNQSGAPYGNNNPSVPLPEHSHAVTYNLHTSDAGAYQPLGKFYPSNTSLDGGTSDRFSWDRETGFSNDGNLISAIPNHSHSVGGNIGIGASGVSNATLDVRGARIAINVWRRVG